MNDFFFFNSVFNMTFAFPEQRSKRKAIVRYTSTGVKSIHIHYSGRSIDTRV